MGNSGERLSIEAPTRCAIQDCFEFVGIAVRVSGVEVGDDLLMLAIRHCSAVEQKLIHEFVVAEIGVAIVELPVIEVTAAKNQRVELCTFADQFFKVVRKEVFVDR